jgi:signal transduction histidine kinase
MRRSALLLGPAGVALGLAAEAVGFGWGDPRHWIPDLVVGWTFIGCGLLAMRRRPESLSGVLLVATGATWFFGNFAAADIGFVAWLAAHLLFLYRGPCVHLVLTYPSGRTRSRLTGSAIAAGYAVSIVNPVWQNATVSILLAVVLVAVSARDHVLAVGPTRRAHLGALQAATVLGLALATEAVIRLALPTSTGNDPLLLGWEAVLVAIAGGLGLGLVWAPWERMEIADFVVELGEERSGTLRSELSRALGDPSLDIGYWLPDQQTFIDAEGRRVSLPEPDTGRAVTMIERDGERIAALVHDPVVLEDPGLVEAVSVAAQLNASNARLQAEVRARLAEVVASRRRIVEAGDEERRRLARRLNTGAEQRLAGLTASLRSARDAARGDTTRERIAQAEAQLTQTLEELRELAQGLHPHVLVESGLAGALAGVVERAPVRVELAISAEGLPSAVEAAVYFVCSEAIANVVKYASASRVVVSVSADDGMVSVAVQDDGIGGADLGRGSGLRGLADRVEALGGTLGVVSPPGGGTRLAAQIPLPAEAA